MKKRKLTFVYALCTLLFTTSFGAGAITTPCYGEESPFVIENNVLVSYEGDEIEVVIPDGIVEIGESAFSGNKKVKQVTLPDSVEVIADRAFSSCNELEQINIPESTKTIGSGAFMDAGLKQIEIASDVEIGQFAFYGCKGLADDEGYIVVNGILFDYAESLIYAPLMTFPQGVKRINGKSFEEDEFGLVVVPDGCEVIEKGAFVVCGIDEIVIPASVTTIENRAFSSNYKDMIMYGYENSAAQEFAEKYNESGDSTYKIDFRLLGVDGDVDGDGAVSLDDANVVLKSALGITKLKQMETSIANVDRKDDITLDDANAALKLALGIVSIEDILLENMDYVVENYLDISIETDKKNYSPGDDLEITVTATNNSQKEITVTSLNLAHEDACYIACELIGENGGVYYSKEEPPVEAPATYKGELKAGETVEANRTIHLDSDFAEGADSDTKYSIRVKFTYSPTGDIMDSKTYTKTFPVNIN